MRRRLLVGGLVIAALVCGGFLWGSAAEEEPAPVVRKAAKKKKAAPKRAPALRPLPAQGSEEEEAVAEAEARARFEGDEPAGWLVHGLVVDAKGNGVSARVWCETEEGTRKVRSDREGRFDLTLTAPGSCRAIRPDGVLFTRSAEGAVGGPPGSEVDIELMLPSERTGGIGITFEPTDEGMRIREVHPDTPAGRAGLEAGDVIVEVDGLPTATLDSWEFIETMTGPEGTGVTFAVAYETDTGTTVEEHRVYRSFLVSSEDGKIRTERGDTGGG